MLEGYAGEFTRSREFAPQQWAFNYPRFACVSISMQIKEVGVRHRLRRSARATEREREREREEKEVEWNNEEDREARGVKVRKRESR